ncbi:hypothetical protein EMIHUDRAFT_456051 [Emiliania huxleyi CCMP1516]|uniref:RAP domain-containing protein n=2 Tax=Emiliania huxleyi TaxID=2903 RepID=A0A0D3K9Y6_EMIH1|nr:hypothetical protein EMIHUDRAFT_456051 [Emiliania huxleyi CCMP1516]EOD32571.1 hypothetical protein EMIHUDRAFT_456051 [Emiliania huxleyi CCMP1516]|eukprot:XP_005785000.1 hypothetical protein EMIHUDRAFT_456051 [Emiliania huxleyi CCMP1516]
MSYRGEERRWRDEQRRAEYGREERRWRDESRRRSRSRDEPRRDELRRRDERWQGEQGRHHDGRHDERRGYNDSWYSGREQRRHAEPKRPAERCRDEPLRGERRPHHDGRHVERRGCNDRPSIGERERDLCDRRDDRPHDPRRDHDRRDRRGEGQPQHSDRRWSPPMRGAGSRDERHTAAGGQLNAKQLSSHISHASGADELLTLFAAHSASLNHIHAANLWNKLGKQRIERRHEGRLEQLVQRTLHLVSSCEAHCSRVISDSLARDPSRWGVVDRSQLHQWQLWLSLERGADGQQHLLSESQRKLCCDAMQNTQVTISEFQRSIAAALAAVQHGFEEEHLEPSTGYSLDLALPSSRVAVEVDGPSHFLLPDGRGVRKPNGPTLLKRRLLTAAGWRVISVPFYEWNGFATASERHTYLQRLLG